ncbi:MAG: NAD(P)H-hydrate dehydratase [Succinivibrionaceae bacterium]|nr:NAD(P)H-hydrate dehydratase [Succinivibrionaceae bacterium]
MELPPHVFNSAEIKSLESDHARAHGGHCYDLMQRAGEGVYRRLLAAVPRLREAWIFVGRGNNGGDGYIVAALLKQHGYSHRVFALGDPHEGSEAQKAASYYRSLGGTVETALPAGGGGREPDAIVDALFGTGLTRAPAAPCDEWIQFINRSRAYRVSIDVPSGVNADTGVVPGDCVHADLTVAMLGVKPGLLTGEAVDYTGVVELEELGVDAGSSFGKFKDLPGQPRLPILQRTYEAITEDLPRREPSFHKGDCGKVLIIGGACGFGGAALIAGVAALRAGAGLVRLALDPANVPAVIAARPELMTVDIFNEIHLGQALEWADVVAVGPGLSQNARAESIMLALEDCAKPLVVDADALNLMAAHGTSRSGNHILTPHPGEAARLLGTTVSRISQDRLESAYLLQERYGGVVLLKGAGSVICDGRRLTIIREGSPAMATGGMGDLLTGVIAALLGQGLSLSQAAVCGACVHGRAGRICGDQDGVVGTLPLDLAPLLRRLANGMRP